MSDRIKTAGCIGSILLVLTTGAVTSFVQAIRESGTEQYLWAFMAVAMIVCLAMMVSGFVLLDH
jgi:magnesium-transporting ATPase (P-type)